MEKYNCIIVDDQEIYRLALIAHVNHFPIFNLIGVYKNAEDAIYSIENKIIDIIFLDIELSGMNGIDFRKKILDIPVCIFVTAFPEYALESYSVSALDFIVKPIERNRFSETVLKIQEYLSIKDKAYQYEKNKSNEYIFLKSGTEKIKVMFNDILYLEAMKDYSIVVCKTSKVYMACNLGTLLLEKKFESFIRVHRSFAVNKDFIKKMKANELILSYDFTLPIGRSYKENLSFVLDNI